MAAWPVPSESVSGWHYTLCAYTSGLGGLTTLKCRVQPRSPSTLSVAEYHSSRGNSLCSKLLLCSEASVCTMNCLSSSGHMSIGLLVNISLVWVKSFSNWSLHCILSGLSFLVWSESDAVNWAKCGRNLW